MLNNRKYAGGIAEESAGYTGNTPAVELRPRYIHAPDVGDGITVHRETAIQFDTVSPLSSNQHLKPLRYSEV